MTKAEALEFAIGHLMAKTPRDADYEAAQDALDVLLGMWSEEVGPSVLTLDIEQPKPVTVFHGEVRPDMSLVDLLRDVLRDEDDQGHIAH